MRAADARIGAIVRVRGNPGLPSELQGLTGSLSGMWGNPWGGPEDLVLEVQLDDGRRRLFWNHELEGTAEGS